MWGGGNWNDGQITAPQKSPPGAAVKEKPVGTKAQA